MKLSQLYIIICFALLWTRCAQDPIEDFPEPSEGEPVFTVSADIGGNPLNLAAGLEDYYMFTSFERDEHEVYVFKGDLKQQSCPNICAEQLRIEIRDDDVSAEEVKIDSSLIETLSFSSPSMPESTVYQVNFYTSDISSGEGIVSYDWNFGDGASSKEANPVHEYPDLGEYFVELKTMDANGCESSQRQVINLLEIEENCVVQIEGSFVQNNSIQLVATSNFETMNTLFLWNDDSLYFNTIFPTETGMYCVQVEDESNCVSSSCAGVMTDSIPLFCTTSFSYEMETIISEPANPFQLSTITVIYTDEAGQEYRTNLGSQDEASLEIHQLEEYDLNENGEKTKKLDFQLSCLLYHENGEVLALTNGIFTFGVAYP